MKISTFMSRQNKSLFCFVQLWVIIFNDLFYKTSADRWMNEHFVELLVDSCTVKHIHLLRKTNQTAILKCYPINT